jgi:hypothetical protein
MGRTTWSPCRFSLGSLPGRSTPLLMVDWAGWGTSIGTLVLAGATFAAIRSSNEAARSAERSARLAERSLLASLRPLLTAGPREGPGHQIQFADGRVLELHPGEALFRVEPAVIYLALSLRNVGTGIAHLRGYRLEPESADRVRVDPLGPARHRRGDTTPDPPHSPVNSGTYTSHPAIPDSGKPRYATPTTHFSRAQSKHSEPEDASQSTSFMGIWRMDNPRLPGLSYFPAQKRSGRCDTAHHWRNIVADD